MKLDWDFLERAHASVGLARTPVGTEDTLLGPPVVPFYPFLGEGYPTKIDYGKKGTLILTSLLEDLVYEHWGRTHNTANRRWFVIIGVLFARI